MPLVVFRTGEPHSGKSLCHADSEAEADSTDESDSEVRFEESVTQFQIPDVPQLVREK